MNPTLAYLAALAVSVGAQARDIPPSIPDRTHVPQGCVVSSTVYIRNLAQVRPEMKARLLHMERRGEQHVMALVTNPAGEQFARDEYTLVHDLHANEREKLNDDELARRALKEHAAAERRNPYTTVATAETRMQLRDAAEKVGKLLPEARTYRTSDGAFVMWNSSPSEWFVYVGDRGTMQIEARKNITEPQLATALSRNLQLGVIQQPANTPTPRQTAALTR